MAETLRLLWWPADGTAPEAMAAGPASKQQIVLLSTHRLSESAESGDLPVEFAHW